MLLRLIRCGQFAGRSCTPLQCLRPPVRHKSNFKTLSALRQTAEAKVRNIGILAHIDAGKTTTTERMLFEAGVTRRAGSVDSGDTVMDFLPQERERGITIASACISFPWKDFRINLIDTPGHVDFTVEVERSLLAMDAVVIILDAAKGVQAQTQTVWRQAVKFGLPSIIYLNKMDKPGANVEKCLLQLKTKLGVHPLPLQIPRGETKTFSILDVFAEPEKSPSRLAVLEALADEDDAFADLFLNDPSSLDAATIESTIRQCCIDRRLSPLLIGSSIRNIGVSQLLDAITRYLPDPLATTRPVVSERLAASTGFYGMAFKNVHDKQKGLLTFLRLYRGSVRPGMSLWNVNKNQKERVVKVMEAYADELKEIPEATEGNMAVVSGLSATITGDTLVASTPTIHEDSPGTSLVPILYIPDPVYFCSVEAGSISQQQALEDALNIILKEDPSIKMSTDAEMGQLIVSGMGELHLEVLKERLRQEFKLDVYMGPLQVAYKEAPTVQADFSHTLIRDGLSVEIHLRLLPSMETGPFKRLKLAPIKGVDFTSVYRPSIHAAENGVTAGLSNGCLMGSPVTNVQVELLNFNASRSALPAIIALAATQCVRELLRRSQCQILEPFMNVVVSVPMNLVPEVMGDLAKRRARIKEIAVLDQETRCVMAETPLAEMLHFSRDLRTATHGMASLDVEFGHYEPMTTFIEETFLFEQTEDIKTIANYIGNLRKNRARSREVASLTLRSCETEESCRNLRRPRRRNCRSVRRERRNTTHCGLL
ncbi:Ribosome-releasing factor 2, mitochondrial [Hypsibius exemplaris]|uniref:Ribosome-releasing factor 2, mitochondrial n=1 Tax=Hypsibius exemplaris TaxID=2072580 RepID=A0A9X6NBX1_HYPEX|nr:Ribosome-releasing factor 2, mitochondrial [Hypsibius exemplaris]